MARRSHEAVVVGGGVVGAASALALVRQGLDVALVEKAAAPPPFREDSHDPRVYALAPASARFLDALGIWTRVVAARVSPYERMQVWERMPARAITFDCADLGAPELGFIVEDGVLRSALWSGLGGAAVHAQAAVTAFVSADGKSQLTLSDGNTLEAPLVVAAEGMESRLRQWAGFETGGWSYPQRSIVCHVETAQPHRRTALQRFLPQGPLAFLPLADGRSSIVWSTDSAEADELMSVDDAGFRARLVAAIDGRLGAIGALTPRLAVPLRLLHATEYVRPGLALVGDSAHVIHPLAGQGVNLGLADAAALATVIADARAQRRPLGALRVLQRYERRRQAANLEVMALTDGLFRLFRSRLPGLEDLRELGLRLVDRSGPIKNALARRAMGPA